MIQKTLCRLGIHQWVHFRDISPFVAGAAVEFGGYVFLPSTKHIYTCSACGARRDTVTDFKGKVIRDGCLSEGLP
jgi:hypothetical protein